MEKELKKCKICNCMKIILKVNKGICQRCIEKIDMENYYKKHPDEKE